MACVQSWTREVPMSDILASPLFPTIFAALESPDSFDAAIDCLIAMVRETRDVDDTLDIIKALSPYIIQLKPKIAEAAEAEDSESFKGLARLYSEVGENWVVLIAREPAAFRPIVDGILEVTSKDWEKEAIGFTFKFWEDLKLWLVMDRWAPAKELFTPIYSQLVDNMIRHLQYPQPESGDETDLFEGDREQEERFRNYRHDMGNVLKDCCEVVGVPACLTKAYREIEKWVATYGPQATAQRIPQWQQLEAPIFAMRALGLVVPDDENDMLPKLIPLIVQIPDHEKLTYQAIMTLGRYTAWTARHPETLQPQLDYIMAAFNHRSIEVVRGATHSFRYFCTDCADILKGFFPQIHQFYVESLPKLPENSQQDVAEGVACIVAKLPIENLYENLKKSCDPIVSHIMQLANNATDEKTQLVLSGKYQFMHLEFFIQANFPKTPFNCSSFSLKE
jgi:transportin-3